MHVQMMIVGQDAYIAHMKQNTVLEQNVETEHYINVIWTLSTNIGSTMININS